MHSDDSGHHIALGEDACRPVIAREQSAAGPAVAHLPDNLAARRTGVGDDRLVDAQRQHLDHLDPFLNSH